MRARSKTNAAGRPNAPRRAWIAIGGVAAVLAVVFPDRVPASAAPSPDVRVSRDGGGSYVDSDGASSDALAGCGAGRRMQNEPSVAVDPSNPAVVVAGSNDYCLSASVGSVWAGYYRSVDGGETWSASLVPGHPGDVSPAGENAPTQVCDASGDPSQSFDGDGRLFYAFICLQRGVDTWRTGSLHVATYEEHGARFAGIAVVADGTIAVQTPVGSVTVFHDKVNIAADQTDGPFGGTAYVGWAAFPSPGGTLVPVILVSRSIDHGRTFLPPTVIAAPGLAQFVDLAVGPDGTVYAGFRTFTVDPKVDSDRIWIVRSIDGGATFGPPVEIARFRPFDSTGFGVGYCGDGPYQCETFTYPRFASMPAVAADETGVHVVWNQRTPQGQSKVFVRSSTDGIVWPAPTRLDTVSTGHQFFPDIASASGTIHVVFFDTRNDPAYDVFRPPGNTVFGRSSGGALDAYEARSTDGGISWTERRLSSVSTNPNWEIFGYRRYPFIGDYNYVSAVPGRAFAAWTDFRDVVAGTDPRLGNKSRGFDVLQQCIYVPNDIEAYSYPLPAVDDPCLSAGGLDQNIYGASL